MADDIAAYAEALIEAVEVALPEWVRRCVSGAADSVEAERAALDHVMPRLRALLAQDIDEQRTNPLSILRTAVQFPTALLRQAGAAPVERDEFNKRNFPDDVYGLTPANFAAFGDEVHHVGMAWGAAKAFVHLQRRRERGPTGS